MNAIRVDASGLASSFVMVSVQVTAMAAGKTRHDRVPLFAEDLHQGRILGVGDLGQGLLHERAIVDAAGLKHFAEAEGGVAEHELGVLEALVVVGDAEVDLFRDPLNLLEQAGGPGHVAGLVLVDAQLRHLLYELRIKEGLLARLGLAGADFERIKRLLVGEGTIGSGSVSIANVQAEGEEDGDGNHSPHRGTPLTRFCPRIVTIVRTLHNEPQVLRCRISME